MSEDRTETLRRDRKRFFWKIEGEVLFSDAFKAIARDGQTVTVYLLILARQTLPPNRKDRIRLEKAGLWPPKDSSFSFPVREARHHGLTEKGLAAGLQRLHEVGIIDRIRAGSALKGDFALYVLSDRWRCFGKPTFNAIPWPKAKPLSVEEERKRRDTNGKFIRRRGRKFLVDAILAATKDSMTANPATTSSPVAAEYAVNSPENGPLVAAESAVLLSSPSLDSDLREVKKKVRALNLGSKCTAAAIRRDDATTSPKQWQPPLSEIRENVSEILRQRPDPRADDPQFVRLISGQLGEALAGRLDPGRVHDDFQVKHGFDDWTTDLLFAVATINLNFMGVTN